VTAPGDLEHPSSQPPLPAWLPSKRRASRPNCRLRANARLRHRRGVADLVEIQTIIPVYRIYRNNIFPLWAVNKYFERKTTRANNGKRN
jgi:hypothetical protein